MQDPDAALLKDIEAFILHNKMTPTKFGNDAVGDPSFVFDLRKGREVRRDVRNRVTGFINGFAKGALKSQAEATAS